MRSLISDSPGRHRLRRAFRVVGASAVFLVGCEARPVEFPAPRSGAALSEESQPSEALPHALADCLVRRLALVEQVARAKWNTHAPIHDPQREDELLERTAQAALARGADPAAWREFFAAQLAASRSMQEELHAQWRAADRPPWPETPDLAAELRPRLDDLNDELLAAWGALARADDRRQWRRAAELLGEKLRTAGYSAGVAAAAAAPLRTAGQ